MWSHRVHYAVRTLLFLAAHSHRWSPARVLAEENGIPGKYLEAILSELRGAGLVHSAKGPGGGYALATDASRLTLFDVVRAVEPDLTADTRPGEVSGGDRTAMEDPILRSLAAQFQQSLREITLSDALMRWQQTQSTLNYVI